MKQKIRSVKTNVLLNIIRQGVNMITPLITVPYISRVLDKEYYGRVSFSRTFVSYFILLAGLGITNYAVREGAKLREDKNKLGLFVSEIFSINFFMTIISYVLLFGIILVPRLNDYRALIIIFSAEIFLNTIGVEWVCSVFEDFTYFTIRTVIVRIATIVATFLFVKKAEDYKIYAIIIVISYLLSNVANFIHSCRFVKFKLTIQTNVRKHIVPILILFGNTVMTTIYISSDNTILGLLSNDSSVGLYTLATQAYSIVKTVINAMTMVTLARLSFYLGNGNREKYNSLLEKTLKGISFIIIPTVAGLFCTAKEAIFLLGGMEYLEASGCLRILSVALIFAVINSILSMEVLIPFGKEKEVFICSLVSAIVNILLNLFLIPLFDYNAAAFTTLIAELLVLIMEMVYCRRLIIIRTKAKDIIQLVVGMALVVGICVTVDFLIDELLYKAIIKIIVSVLVYVTFMLLVKNEMMLYCKEYLLSILLRKRKK